MDLHMRSPLMWSRTHGCFVYIHVRELIRIFKSPTHHLYIIAHFKHTMTPTIANPLQLIDTQYMDCKVQRLERLIL